MIGFGRWNRTGLLGIGIFIFLLATTFVGGMLYRSFWIFGPLAVAAIWVTAVVIAMLSIGRAFRDANAVGYGRLRAALAIPLAIIAVLVIHLTTAVGPRLEASTFLAIHSDEMQRAMSMAGTGRPASIRYTEGIPDGGSAIVRWNSNPMKLPEPERTQLVNRNMHSCLRIIGGWLCGFG